nr:MAG TPA: hypothetical protein [Caudoviricetes sp.]
MAKNHAIFNGTHCAFWDVDAYNLVGIATAEIDNATFLALGDIKLKTDDGYEFTVTAGGDGTYIAGTPAQGYGIEAGLFDDPRYFTNEAGKPISVKRLVAGDCIEVDLVAFTADPVANGYAKVDASGKLTGSVTSSDPFKILGTHTIDCGGELVKTWILMKQ